ncbi:FtsX-like permease family protein [Streptomyces sp. NPDC050617]|uniref:FtsX-like permease family protein n=1 Tax=Streptomyces sp. NPDC050617 TaxID=3154628 RepID=UPI0034383815
MALLQLAWWTVRSRRTDFAGSFVAMVCAQALVTACAVLLESGARAGAAAGGPDVVAFAVPFGFISLFVAAFAVAGTFSLSVQQRTREIALLRAIAATPRQVRRMVAYEALVVTVAALLPGCGLGVLLAAGLRAALTGQGLFSPDFRLDFGPVSLASAAAVCWVTAEAAVWSSGRRAARVRAMRALGEAAAPRRRAGWVRTAAGLLVLGGGVWGLESIAGDPGSSSDVNAASGMVMVFMIAIALLAPWIGRLVGAGFGGLCRLLFSGVGYVAGANLGTGHRRLASAIMPLALTVAFAAVSLFVPQMKWREQQRQDSGRMVADQIVTSGDELPADAARTVRRVPGVAAAVGTTSTYAKVLTGEEDARHGPGGVAQAVTDGPLGRVLDLGATGRPGSRGTVELGAHDVALSERLARAAGARTGDEVRLLMDDDRVERVRVAYRYTRGDGFGDIVLPQRIAARHLMDGETLGQDTVYVRSAPGHERAVADGLAALAQGRHAGWRVLDHAAYAAEARHRQDASMTVTYLLLAVITVFTSISVVNTLVMTTMERSGEFALLRLVGATRRQIGRMTVLENAVTVLAALLLGSAVAGAVLAGSARALTGTARLDLSPSVTALIVGGAGALALVTGVVTTRIALAQRPATALRAPG